MVQTWASPPGVVCAITPLIFEMDLVDGDNTVSITCTSGEDKLVFDWFTVAYDRAFSADSDTFKFTYETGYQFPIAGFTSDSIVAFDMTDHTAVKRITDAAVTGSGPYAFTFEPPAEVGEMTYLVLADDQILTPHSLIATQPHGLSEGEADWILITHRDLGWDINGDPQPWLDEIMALRQAQGLRVQDCRCGPNI